MSSVRPETRVLADPASVGRAAADFILDCTGRALHAGGWFTIALSGGATPRTLYALLASSPWKESFPFNTMHFFWADERCVPPDHAESNFKLASDAFLSHVPVQPSQIHRIHGEEGPEAAAEAYEKELALFFGAALPRFDLVLLGVGEDGHTASLFPGTRELSEKNHTVLPVHLPDARRSRVTLTLPVLNQATQVLFLATGTAKAAILHDIIAEGNPNQCPAGLVRPEHGSLLWMIDNAAASRLPGPRGEAAT